MDLGNDNEIDHTGNPIDTFEDIMDAYSDIISLTGIFKLLYTSSNQPTWKHLRHYIQPPFLHDISYHRM